jgi:hypothetical protein
MRIFALETDKEKLLQSLLAPNEKVLRRASFHVLRYLGGFLRFIVLTALAGALGYGGVYFAMPDFTPWIILGLWFFFVLFPFINVLIDWWHDAIVVTDEEVVIIDQTSIFRRSIRQMSLENIASVSDHTQWGNVFSFGRLQFDLKEGTGQHFAVSFVPRASEMASTISDAVVAFHRREIESHGHRRHDHVPPTA